MDGGFALAAVVRATQRFAIKGDNVVIGDGSRGLNPGQKAGLELLGVKSSEDATKGVMRGDAVGQIQEGAEPAQFGGAELLDLNPAIGATDHGTDSNRENVEQVVALGALDSWILEWCEVVAKAGDGRLVHRSPHQIIRDSRSILRHHPAFAPPYFDAIALAQTPPVAEVDHLGGTIVDRH